MIGRKEEIQILKSLENSNRSAFVAIYGRRRVGKTYMVRQVFHQKFTFYITGIANVELSAQLTNFHASLIRYFPWMEDKTVPSNWFQAFQYLISSIETEEAKGRKVLFFDELPWLDYPNSDFVPALEHFWNSWASARTDISLLACGSAASWMLNKLINNHGGLHNRVTHRMPLEPFTLAECEAFLQQKSASYNRYQIAQLYMALGGVPFYLEMIDTSKSITQNINDLCFTPRGALRKEYQNLYPSLFKNATRHQSIIEALAKKAKGLERPELLRQANLSDGGTATKTLRELEASGFIRKYPAFGKKNRYTLYQLSDFYSFFYLRFIKDSSDLDKNFWVSAIDSPEVREWSGYAFEQVCLAHLDQLKQKLGISGIQTRSSAWVGSHEGQKAQIDLVIDRRDQVINLFEMKFSIEIFKIDKAYAQKLRSKIQVFKAATQTKKAIFMTFVSTFGVEEGVHGGGLVQNNLTIDELF
ncbi:MAG: ATP-binding protein [Bacteroidota bacterium]